MMTQTVGRRERKKAATRQSLTDAALKLFVERGYDKVTVAEVAEEADTAIATLFAHFPGGKEALIFDDGSARKEALEAAVRDRPDGVSVLDAVHAYLARRGPFAANPDEELRTRTALVVQTPALRAYARTLWIDCQDVLAEAIADSADSSVEDPAVRVLARYVLELPDLLGSDENAHTALDVAFEHLRRGWPDL